MKKDEKPFQQISRRLKEYELTSQIKRKIPENFPIGNVIITILCLIIHSYFFLKQQKIYKDFYICILDNGTIVEALYFAVYNILLVEN